MTDQPYASGAASLFTEHLRGQMRFTLEFSEPDKQPIRYCGMNAAQAERLSGRAFGSVVRLAERYTWPIDLTCEIGRAIIHITSEIVVAEVIPC